MQTGYQPFLKNYFKIPRIDSKTGAPQQVYQADEIVELDFLAIMQIDITKTKSNQDMVNWADQIFRAADVDYSNEIDTREFTLLYQNIESVLTQEKWLEIRDVFWEIKQDDQFLVDRRQFEKFTIISKTFTRKNVSSFGILNKFRSWDF